MYKWMIICFLLLISALILIPTVECYARVTRVFVYTSPSAMVNEQVNVLTHIHTGNNVRERVREVTALLILPEEANLTCGVNPVFIGEMGPGPANAYCNWTVVFTQPGVFTVSVNVSCLDTQDMPRWLMNSTTIEVYDFPHVKFSHPVQAYANRTVVFNASKSYACGPNASIVAYEWSFGDGVNITSSEPVVQHEYNTVGNYTVFLKAIDNRNLSKVMMSSIRIGLFGDVNWDNLVNILDVSIVAHSFNSHPGDERWNVECDLNGDNVVDIVDVSLVAKQFGRTA